MSEKFDFSNFQIGDGMPAEEVADTMGAAFIKDLPFFAGFVIFAGVACGLIVLVSTLSDTPRVRHDQDYWGH